MSAIIKILLELLDAILDETDKLDPAEASDARQRLMAGMALRAARISNAEAGDLAAIPKRDEGD